MRRYFLIIFMFSICLFGCEKLDIPSDYPSTYLKQPLDSISIWQSEYISRNPYLTSSLNEYGFCDVVESDILLVTPPHIGDISQSEAENIVKEFITRNPSETGVEKPDELSFSSASTFINHEGSILWHFKSENQKVDTIEVLYTKIYFHLINGCVTSCYRNWYPEIYIPEEFNFNQSKAKTTLDGHTVTHYDIGGAPFNMTITSIDLEESEIDLKIIPKEIENRIELRLCWEIYIPGVHYKIYIDVMYGNIIYQIPTMIS